MNLKCYCLWKWVGYLLKINISAPPLKSECEGQEIWNLDSFPGDSDDYFYSIWLSD